MVARLCDGEIPSGDAGRAGSAQLVNNLLAGINLVGVAEVVVLAERLDLDLPATLDVIEQSSGQSWIGSDRMHRAIAGNFEPRTHITLLEKDTRLADLDDGALLTLLRGSWVQSH